MALFGRNPQLCPLCRHDVFRDGRVELMTGTAAFADLEWLNPSALVLSYDSRSTRCGSPTTGPSTSTTSGRPTSDDGVLGSTQV
jgi:hypothetical protein